MLDQALAHHLRIPGIVLLLAAGVVLGPDVAGVVRPDSLGSALPILVGYAVAIVLFEGGMNLNIQRLRRSAHSNLWMVRLERNAGLLQRWFRNKPGDKTAIEEIGNPPDSDSVMLPLAVMRSRIVLPFTSDLSFKKGDQLHVVVNRERRDEAEAWL